MYAKRLSKPKGKTSEILLSNGMKPKANERETVPDEPRAKRAREISVTTHITFAIQFQCIHRRTPTQLRESESESASVNADVRTQANSSP